MVDSGRRFLEHLIDEDIADCCQQFVGRRLVERRPSDDKSVMFAEVATAVLDVLVARHGADRAQLAVAIGFDQARLSVMPGNLYTFLLLSGIKASTVSGTSYRTSAGTYVFDRHHGGRFVPAQS